MAKDPKSVLARHKRVSDHGTNDDPKGIDGSEIYRPYEIGSRSPERLHIIRLDDTMHYPSYRYLMDIVHTGSNNGIVLVYSFMLVKIVGENLGELLEHLSHGDCAFIQQYDAREWPQRPEKGKPIITKIDVVVREGGDEERMMDSLGKNSTRH